LHAVLPANGLFRSGFHRRAGNLATGFLARRWLFFGHFGLFAH